MTRFDKIFRVIGILVSYYVLTVFSIILIKHDFGTKFEWLMDFAGLNIGALGLFIFYKWVKE